MCRNKGRRVGGGIIAVALVLWAGCRAFAEEPQGALPGAVAGTEDDFSRRGVLSLGVAFGSQASPYGREAAGLRWGLGDDTWVATYVQAGRNASTRKRAWGAHLELGYDLTQVDRARLALVPIVAYGLSKDEALDTEDVQWGAALALQLEVFLTRQVSTALRIEAGGQLAPEEDVRLSTASSEVLVYYHLR